MKRIMIFLLMPLLIDAQWIKQESSTIEKLTDVVMLDSVTAIAVGEGRSILRTSNAGKTWINLTIMLSSVVPWYGVAFEDSLNGVVVGYYQIRFTSDGGKLWLVNTPPYRRKFLSALYPFPGVIYVGADSGWIFHSIDTGKTWIAQQIGSTSIRSLFAWFNGPTEWIQIFALMPTALYSSWMVTSEPWEKTNFKVQGLGSEIFDGEFSPDGKLGYVVGVQGDIWSQPRISQLRLFDTSWTYLTNGVTVSGILHSVSAPSEKFVYTCGTNGLIFNSTDGGDTWQKYEVPTSQNLNAISFFNNSIGMTVGDSGIILYTKNGGVTTKVDEKNFLPKEFFLSQNFPNPFNPTTKIKYTVPAPPNLPQGEALITLKIYDILGDEVAALVNEEKPSGEYEVEFDGNNLSSGIYFYQLKVGNFVKIKKLILLK